MIKKKHGLDRAAFGLQETHHVTQGIQLGDTKQGAALSVLFHQSNGDQPVQVMGQVGRRNVQPLLNLTDREPIGSGLDQQTEHRHPRRMAQFTESFDGCFLVHAWMITV